jgi:hypothetical protein
MQACLPLTYVTPTPIFSYATIQFYIFAEPQVCILVWPRSGLARLPDYTPQRISHLHIPRKGIARRAASVIHIQMSMSHLYISRISPHIFLQQNRQTDRGNE